MALFIIAFLLCALAIAGFIYHFVNFKKDRLLNNLDNKIKCEFILCIALFAVSCVMCGYGIVLMNKLNLDALHHVLLILGSLIFGVSFMILLETFTIYYYKPELAINERKIIRKLMFIMIPITIVAFFLSTEGYAKYLTFPLVSGINFSSKGVVFFSEGSKPTGGFSIAWYGIIMLIGAVVAYLVCDHHLYKEYKRHGIIDTMFVLVFLMGVLGARLWYCAVLEHDMSIFWQFQNGGLAIMGGALFGALSGIAFILLFRRYINIRHAMDLILPCVLIAQAIGRWGNFFNCEVHGNPVDGAAFMWLPTIVFNQLKFSSVGSSLMGTNNIYMPLFLLESIVNLSGYFVINYLVRKGVNKHLSLGDLFFLYIVWYGMTRVIFEPLRYSEGGGTYRYSESYIAAWVMFGGGLACIIGLHLYDYFRWGKKTFKISTESLIQNAKNPYYKKVETNNETVKN